MKQKVEEEGASYDDFWFDFLNVSLSLLEKSVIANLYFRNK